MVESVETVIIGAGHAGLSTSYFLKQHGCEHVVLDKAGAPGNAWRERWDSFTFVTPNWTFQLPGGEYDGPEPDGFMTRAELANCFDRYVEKHQLPVAYHTRVQSIEPLDGPGYRVQTDNGSYQARNVVAANGWFGVGKRPEFASKVPADVLQLHTSAYRSPQSLPPGAVLVVGSAQSGAQIAEELNQSGRRVFLATGAAPHAPRSYRGKDIFRWLDEAGFFDRGFDQMQFMGKGFIAPMISGKDGGHALNLHQFYCDGIILTGHACDYSDGRIILANDLKENLEKADRGLQFVMGYVDNHIQRNGVIAPPDDTPRLSDGYQAPEITELDLRAEGIRTIIWACGYGYDTSMFSFPVLDQKGLPDAPQGASRNHPGLYFAGFPFLPTFRAGIVVGASQSAARVAEKIAG